MCRQQFFKHQLLLNRLANLDQTWQECSLGGPLWKNCSQNLIPSKTLVAMATKWNFLANSLKIFSSETASRILKLFHRDVPWVTLFKNCSWNYDPSKIVALVNGGFLHYTEMKEFFKNLLLWNHWLDCEIISQICSLGDPFQKLFVKFWSVKKCGSGEWGLLALYRNEGILKKSSSVKPMVRFWNNFTELLLGWPFLKIVREILNDEETWLWWMRATCTIGKWRNS